MYRRGSLCYVFMMVCDFRGFGSVWNGEGVVYALSV
jgi:hypothetical protein